MLHSLSKDTAFTRETAPCHTFLCSDSQCLPPGDPRILCAKHGYPITGKSFIGLRALLGILVKIIPSFPGAQPLYSCSVPCPSYPLIRVLLSFTSVTGTKPAFLIWGFRLRSTSCSSSFLLWKLVYECCTLGIHLLLYLHTYFAGLVLAKPSQNSSK